MKLKTKKEKNEVLINFRIPQSWAKLIKEICTHYQVSKSDLLREGTWMVLDNIQKKFEKKFGK